MASIEHIMPADIKPLDGSRQGFYRPGLEVSTYQTGYRSSRDWFEYNLRSYTWNLNRFSASKTYLKQYQAFLDHIRMGGRVGWITEALSTYSKEMVIGPLGDGSRTTFVIPVHNQVSSPSDFNVFVDGEPSLTGGTAVIYTINLLDDDQANAVDATTGMNAMGTCAISRSISGVAADGLTSFLVDPTGTVSNYGVVSDYVAVTGAKKLTFMVAVKGTGDYTIKGEWFDAVPASLGSTTDTATLTSWSGWTILSVTGTTHANTTQVKISVYKTDSSDENFYAGCFGINRGDLDKWFLPSEAPSVVEFATAPTTRQRITASGTYTRMARCRVMAPRGLDWALASPGDAYGMRFTALEEIES